MGTTTEFRREIEAQVKLIAQPYKLPSRTDLDVGLLIEDLKTKTGKPVSILVDNYDLPLMKKLSTKKREKIVDILAEFYEQIRANWAM